MKKLTSRLLAVTALLATMIAIPLATSLPAKANFVLDEFVFADLGATGFGNAPRLLTLQNDGLQSGAVISTNGVESFLSPISVAADFSITGIACTNNGNCNGGLKVQDQKSALVNVTNLWTSGAEVGVGLDTNQTGSSGAFHFEELVMNIYDAAGNILGTFGNNGPVDIGPLLLALQQGNGNSVFNIELDAAEQAEFDAIVAALPPGGQIFAGLAAIMGCEGGTNQNPCAGDANDGADSFLAFKQSASVPVPAPIVGAGIPGMLTALGGLYVLARRRRARIA